MASQSNLRFEVTVQKLAARQHGVVARAQLINTGISRHMVQTRLNSGRLVRVHRGVYRIGTTLSPLGAAMAACLIRRAGVVVCGTSAARLWGILPGNVVQPVSVGVRCGNRRVEGVHAHLLGTLLDCEVSQVEGIPVTTVPRTVLDLAHRESQRVVEQAVSTAVRKGILSKEELATLVAAHTGEPGVRRMRGLIGANPTMTRSQAEELVLDLVRQSELPDPLVNSRVHVKGQVYEVDFLWPKLRLVVEVDGWAYHKDKESFKNDRLRDRRLTAAGYHVMRLTWDDLINNPIGVVGDIARRIGAAES